MASVQVLSPTRSLFPLNAKPNSVAVVDVQQIGELSDNEVVANLNHASLKQRRPSAGSLISASLITTDFDALRFDAAASLQIVQAQQSLSYSTSTPRSQHLISSPYNDPNHLLDLRTLDAQSRLLSQALSFMKPVHDDYATADYETSFNWDDVLAVLRSLSAAEKHEWIAQDFYTVIFRSQLNPNVDEQRLHDLDKNSHREAVESGGLLKYWFGKRNEHERNLATCKFCPHSRLSVCRRLC